MAKNLFAYAPEYFTCDCCNHPIREVYEGVVALRRDLEGVAKLELVHRKCAGDVFHYDVFELSSLLGEEGLTRFLSLLSPGMIRVAYDGPSQCAVQDLDEYVDLGRRLYVEHYEAARRHFGDPRLYASLPVVDDDMPYVPDTLEEIIDVFTEDVFTEEL